MGDRKTQPYLFHVREFPHHVIVFRTPDYQVCLLDKQHAQGLGQGLHSEWSTAFPLSWRTAAEPTVDLREPSLEQTNDWPLRQLYIIATGKCNLRCSYCAQSRGQSEHMPAQAMTLHVSRFLQQSANPRAIVFYGGEPLLNWPAVRASIDRARQSHPEIEINIFTNGVLVDDDIAGHLAKHRVGCIVSMDGDAMSHDKARRLHPNAGSYLGVEAGFLKLIDKGCVTGISCVVGPHNANRIREVVAHLCRLGPANIGMTILHHQGRTGYHFSPEAGAAAVIEAMQAAAEHGVEIEHVARRLRPFVLEAPRQGDCPACGHRLVVTPDGHFGPCEGAFPFKTDWFFKTWSEAQALSSRLAAWPCQNDACPTCPAQGLCGGGCVLDAHLEEECPGAVDRRTCSLSRALLEHALQKIDSTSGLPLNQVLSVQEKMDIFSPYLVNTPRPMRDYSTYGEKPAARQGG